MCGLGDIRLYISRSGIQENGNEHRLDQNFPVGRRGIWNHYKERRDRNEEKKNYEAQLIHIFFPVIKALPSVDAREGVELESCDQRLHKSQLHEDSDIVVQSLGILVPLDTELLFKS